MTAICPASFDWGAPLELKAKFGKKLSGGIDVFNHDLSKQYWFSIPVVGSLIGLLCFSAGALVTVR